MPGPDYSTLQAELRDAGITADTPCLLVSAASRIVSRTYRTVAGKIAEIPALPAPSILIVGDVTRLARDRRAAARWWGDLAETAGRTTERVWLAEVQSSGS
jgi:siroheme synthase